MNPQRLFFCLLTTTVLMLAGRARGAVAIIEWGNEVGSTNYTSDGTSAWDASPAVVPHLGVFTSGFVPTADNTALWAANWAEIDSSLYNPTLGYFAQTTELADNATFAAGTQAYIWAYNTTERNQATEWMLFTNDSSDSNAADNWTIPTAPVDQTTPSTVWNITGGDTTNIIFGGFQTTGTGGFSSEPGSGYDLQTHTLGSLLNGVTEVTPGDTLTLPGGTLSVSGITEAVSLTVTGDTIVDFGSGGSTLTLGSFGGVSGGTLSIYNWTHGSDFLLVDSGSLQEYSNIQFYSDNGVTPIRTAGGLVSYGSGYALVPVPEPGAMAAGLFLLGPLLWRQRRSLLRCREAVVAGRIRTGEF